MTQYLFTFGGKLGYALCNWLPYVTGGLAVGDTDFNGKVAVPDFVETLPIPENEEAHRFQRNNTQSRAGWVVAARLGYSLTNHRRLAGHDQDADVRGQAFRRGETFGVRFASPS